MNNYMNNYMNNIKLYNYETIEKLKHVDKNFNYPKIMFLYWDLSNLSYLNLLTVISFNKHNPNWNIVVFIPENQNKNISWKSNEQKLKYSEKCYFNRLFYIENVHIFKINLDTIGFYSNASEVIKSDYFRYYILEKHGGLWSDFDILYTDNIEKKMNFKENNIIFKIVNRFNFYFPVGMFLCKQNSKLFSFIKNNCKKFYNKNHYQSIGASMFSSLFRSNELIYNIDNSVKICNKDYYLPWEWNQLDEFLHIKKQNNVLPNNNIGIHWFNGADISKIYSIQLEKRLQNFNCKCFLDKQIEPYIKNKEGLLKIFIFGSNGMLGNYVKSYLSKYEDNNHFTIIPLTRKEYDINILSKETLIKILKERNIEKNDIIINCAGLIPQASNQIELNSEMFYNINSKFPVLLNEICKSFNLRMIQITTDCVFSGKDGNYNEESVHDETNDYGKSKSLGEKINATIIRTSIIGEELRHKRSLLEWVKSNKNGEINGYINHKWNGITCLTLAKIIFKIILNKQLWNGVRHIFSPNSLSKYELSGIINNVYDLNITINKFKAKKNIDKTITTLFKMNNTLNIPTLKEQIIELKNYKF